MINVHDAAEWFIQVAANKKLGDGEGVTMLKLQKLLWYAYGWWLAQRDEPLFEARVEAWANGPVIPSVYHRWDEARRGARIEPDPKWNVDTIPEDVKAYLWKVWLEYGQYSAWRLREMTHAPGTPWHRCHREGVRNVRIPDRLIRTYFARKANPLGDIPKADQRRVAEYLVKSFTASAG